MHRHSRQDEFAFVLAETPTLVTDLGEVQMRPGMCACFNAAGIAHHLVDRTEQGDGARSGRCTPGAELFPG